MFTGRFVLDIPLGTGRFLNQMAKWYRLGAYRLNPFGVREVSKLNLLIASNYPRES